MVMDQSRTRLYIRVLPQPTRIWSRLRTLVCSTGRLVCISTSDSLSSND